MLRPHCVQVQHTQPAQPSLNTLFCWHQCSSVVCRPGQGPPPDFSALLNDPAMMQSMQSMFASMSPQQMSDMSRQAGMPITEQQVTP